ncbi:MAG: hypothetical protein V2A69_09625 [Pseudomonadota bacterium]
MGTEQVIKNVEGVIKAICRDIRQKKGCGSEKIGRLSQLVNAYHRLINSQLEEYDPEVDGKPNYYDQLEASFRAKLKGGS